MLKGWQSTIYDTPYLKEFSYRGLRSTTVFLEPGREGSSASSLHESGSDGGWLGLGGALERVVVPRTFGAQPDGLVVVPGVILGRVCGRRGQCPLPPDAATTWPTAPTRRSTSSSPSSMQRSRGAPTACSAVASSCRPRGALLVESAKQASLALLAVVARLGWSAARWVIEGDHRCRSFVQAILLVSPSECVVCIPRHQQHFEIERAEGAAASVVPTAINSGTGAGILCRLCVTSFRNASTSYQEA